MKLVRGFTFIELLIVLIVGSGLLLASSSFTSPFSKFNSAKRINSEAKIVLNSMNHFYLKHCGDIVFPTVTLDGLKNEGFLSSYEFKNPWGGGFQLDIDRTTPHSPLMILKLEFNSVEYASLVSTYSQNATFNNKVVTWHLSGSLSQSLDGVMLQLDKQAFDTDLC